jgi:hypothetical protein
MFLNYNFAGILPEINPMSVLNLLSALSNKPYINKQIKDLTPSGLKYHLVNKMTVKNAV